MADASPEGHSRACLPAIYKGYGRRPPPDEVRFQSNVGSACSISITSHTDRVQVDASEQIRLRGKVWYHFSGREVADAAERQRVKVATPFSAETSTPAS